jgi:hypothetical protein
VQRLHTHALKCRQQRAHRSTARPRMGDAGNDGSAALKMLWS